MADVAQRTTDRWSYPRRATVVITLFLLLSFGGAIFAAPVSVPVLWLTMRTEPRRSWRTAAATSLVLTAAELAWAFAYAAAGEDSPLVWAVPLTVAAVLIAFLRSKHSPTKTSGFGHNPSALR